MKAGFNTLNPSWRFAIVLVLYTLNTTAIRCELTYSMRKLMICSNIIIGKQQITAYKTFH